MALKHQQSVYSSEIGGNNRHHLGFSPSSVLTATTCTGITAAAFSVGSADRRVPEVGGAEPLWDPQCVLTTLPPGTGRARLLPL